MVASALAVSSALAQDAAPGESEAEPVQSDTGPSYERGGLAGAGLVLGAKAGGGFSQAFGDLGSSFLTQLEIGYTLPVMHRSLEVFVAGGYTQPKATGKNINDSRLPGPASYTLKQQEAMVDLGLRYRVRLDNPWLRPYAALGPRLYMTRTQISGRAGGQSFGNNSETQTRAGVFGAVGGEFYLGPGALLVELSMAWAKLDGYVMRNTSMGAMGASLGYRIFI